jgi:hypothetical protein
MAFSDPCHYDPENLLNHETKGGHESQKVRDQAIGVSQSHRPGRSRAPGVAEPRRVT